MKKYLFLAAMLLGAGGLIAQKPETDQADDSQVLAQAAPRQNHAAVKKEAAKTQEQDSEEAGVVIDSKSEDTEDEASYYSSKNNAKQPEEAAFASYIPASYGQLKGVLIEQGRNVLVFENEDGILSFVQASVGKNSVTWKLLARVARSQN